MPACHAMHTANLLVDILRPSISGCVYVCPLATAGNMQRRASEPLPGLVLGTGFEDFIDSTYGFNILGPDPDDPTASVMQPALQRRCSPNGTAPFAINPVKPQSGICLEGTLYQESSSGVVHYTTDLTEHAAVDPKLNLTQYGVERVSVLASRN